MFWEHTGGEPDLIWEDFPEELIFDLRAEGWVNVNQIKERKEIIP